jgi:hypothetical protein
MADPWLITPPIQGPALPSTPTNTRPALTSPPPRQSTSQARPELLFPIPAPVFTPEPEMPGGFEDHTQRSALLREMDAAPRRSARLPVPNPQYFNADNVAHRGHRLGYAELLAAAYVRRDPAFMLRL